MKYLHLLLVIFFFTFQWVQLYLVICMVLSVLQIIGATLTARHYDREMGEWINLRRKMDKAKSLMLWQAKVPGLMFHQEGTKLITDCIFLPFTDDQSSSSSFDDLSEGPRNKRIKSLGTSFSRSIDYRASSLSSDIYLHLHSTPSVREPSLLRSRRSRVKIHHR